MSIALLGERPRDVGGGRGLRQQAVVVEISRQQVLDRLAQGLVVAARRYQMALPLVRRHLEHQLEDLFGASPQLGGHVRSPRPQSAGAAAFSPPAAIRRRSQDRAKRQLRVTVAGLRSSA